MSDEISYGEYWSQVRALAEEAAAEHGRDTEGGREWIWETCDGHSWVIYTARNFDVLRHSPNDGYSVENFGPEGIVTDAGPNWMLLAFGALYGDVMECYGELEPFDPDAIRDAVARALFVSMFADVCDEAELEFDARGQEAGSGEDWFDTVTEETPGPCKDAAADIVDAFENANGGTLIETACGVWALAIGDDDPEPAE